MTTRPAPALAAVLLDFDGTLVDTEPLWGQGEIDLLGARGVPWTEDQARRLCGTSRQVSMRALLDQMARHGVDVDAIDPIAFYDELWRTVYDAAVRDGLPWLPGVVDLLADLADEGIPCALVSSSPWPMLDACLELFPRHNISVVVSGDDVPAGKPAPDGYLMAAGRLGVDPTHCLVIEDSASGTAAGLAAGAVVVAVPHMRPLHDSPGQVMLEDLAGMTTARLRKLFASVRAGLPTGGTR